jgi:hypothetical protein
MKLQFGSRNFGLKASYMRKGAFRGDSMGVAAPDQAAFKTPEALAIWAAMASISGGDRQS